MSPVNFENDRDFALPERFSRLQPFALDLLKRLERDYDVFRSEAFELAPRMRPFEHARPPVTLTPTVPTAAPIAIGFAPHPSVIVRFGRWVAEPFPSCACDACEETAESEAARLEELITEVVAGRFREEVRIPVLGHARLIWSFGEHSGHSAHRSGWSLLPRSEARALRRRGSGATIWGPWPKRSNSGPD